MRHLTWREVCGRRLARHCLLELLPQPRLEELVSAVCGIQAQVLSAAELALGVRVAGLTRQDVQTALWADHSLVKTYGPRGTLHLLPAAELPLWMAAMRAASAHQEPHWYASAGLTPEQGEALLESIGDALDRRQLTREELTEAVSRHVGDWAREGLSSTWGQLLGPAAFTGRLCFGPSQGTKVTFVRADQWIGHWEEFDPDAALAEVCRRYLAAYGPVTAQNFGRWFRLKPNEARQVIESLTDEVEQVQVGSERAWLLAADVETPWGEASASLHLLPQYDCYVLGCGQRERIVPPAAKARLFSYGRGRYEGAVGLPILLADGIVAGMWAQRKRGQRLELTVEPFSQLTSVQQDLLAKSVSRLSEFLGMEAVLALARLDETG